MFLVIFSMCQPWSCTQTVVLSGMGSLQYVVRQPMLCTQTVGLSGMFLAVFSMCTDSPGHVPRLCFCLAWAVFSMCQFQSCTQSVGLSGMGSLQYVPALVMYTDSFHCMPALVMYPGCGPVWHGHSSVCASPSHVHGQFSVCAIPCHVLRLWSCLAWTVFNTWCASPSRHMCQVEAGSSVQS